MRNNAERLLRDIRLAHGGMTARLDQAAPAEKQARRRFGRSGQSAGAGPPRGAGAPSRSDEPGEGEDYGDGGDGEDLDVPEFIPRS